MKKKLFICILLIIPIALFAVNTSKNLHKVVYCYNAPIDKILMEQQHLNINEYIFLNYGHESDTIKYYIKKGIIKMKYRKNYSAVFAFFMIYKQNEEWYAKMITDTAIYKSIKLDANFNKYFNLKKIKPLAFNKKEISKDYLPWIGVSDNTGVVYWNCDDIYYFYSDYSYKNFENCYTSKQICQVRRKYLDSLTIEIRKILPLLEVESYHNYGH